jgi:diaminohydroxyphosphoribosylaminopyrimidine deaminase/5-amino-6-(5-phosphoribosylamino)uracil reductase
MATINTKSVSSDLSIDRAMRRAIDLARSVRGRTSPNPPVGAVVLQGDQVVGQGATKPPGGAHAEVVALEAAGNLAKGGTLVVTLEPCNHVGRTPACTEAIRRADIARVIIATRDSNPHVPGGGLEALQGEGIEIGVSQFENEAAELIRPYLSVATAGRPYVTAKWAMTLDGKIAGPRGGESITGTEAMAEAHLLRDQVDAVVIGSETARIDDPRLTVRPAPSDGRQPLRVVLDSDGSLHEDARVIREEGKVLVVTVGESAADRARLEQAGAEIRRVEAGLDGRVDVVSALEALGDRGVAHALVEGGALILGSLFAAQRIDEVVAFVAPRVMRFGIPAVDSPAGIDAGIPHQLDDPVVRQLGQDVMIRGRMVYNTTG